MTSTGDRLSIILPCLNESHSLAGLLERLHALYPAAEIIVVDDGSEPSVTAPDYVTVLRHPQNIGNGAAIKTGARHASREILVFMDSDGQHDPDDIGRLLEKLEQGYAMAVGARAWHTHASRGRRVANLCFNKLASIMTGFRVDDLTSGFRAAYARHFRKFLYLLPNGFSYPTTSTMAFFRCGHPVGYVPIEAKQRQGKSKIRVVKDGLRFLVIILRIGALFSPMRFFLPISLALFLLGTFWHGYTFITVNRFTNMGAVLYLSALFTMLFGIISEQISALHYRYSEERRRASDFASRPARDRENASSG
jgi:glycosyltransferase involved in cell wall biosynthesis